MTNIFEEHGWNQLQQILANWIQQYIIPGMQGFLYIHKSIVIHDINKILDNTHKIISIDEGKAFNRIHLFLFLIIKFQQIRYRENGHTLTTTTTKVLYDKLKLISYSVVKSWKIFSKIRTKMRMLTFSIFVQHSIRRPNCSY